MKAAVSRATFSLVPVAIGFISGDVNNAVYKRSLEWPRLGCLSKHHAAAWCELWVKRKDVS